jgi:hypothetical protein
MAAVASDHASRWQPFGVTESAFAAVPERDGVRVVNVKLGNGDPGSLAGRWLGAAAGVLALLAAGAAAVSWQAQYAMVWGVKQVSWVAAVEAGIPDAGALVFAALGVALALHGKRALRPRALNLACNGISLCQNALAAGHGWKDLAIWVMPAAVYALASDTLIGVVRAWVLARQRDDGQALAEDGPTPLALVGGLALWLLRLSLAPGSTLTGFRSWVVTDCPVAPGLRPGHVAELDAARKEAAEQIAQAVGRCDELVECSAAQMRQAREEAALARTAETAIRAELDRTRADASQIVTRALADAARERDELRAWSERQADSLRTELAQVRDDADRMAGQVRDSAAAQVAALEQASAELRGERDRLAFAASERDEVRAGAERQIGGLLGQLQQVRDDAARLVARAREDSAARVAELQADRVALGDDRDRLAAELRACAHQLRQGNGRLARTGQARGARRDGPTKRARMIELAGQRRDLAAVPLAEVSKLASAVAAEIGYSPGTARRELVRHVRELQGVPGESTPDSEGGQAR